MVDTATKSEFSERLNAALDAHGVAAKGHGRQTAVAARLGVSQKGARKWLEGEAIPSMARLSALATWLGVSGDWLLTGADYPPGASPTDPDASGDALDVFLLETIIVGLARSQRWPDAADVEANADALARTFAEAYQTLSAGARAYSRRRIDELLQPTGSPSQDGIQQLGSRRRDRDV